MTESLPVSEEIQKDMMASSEPKKQKVPRQSAAQKKAAVEEEMNRLRGHIGRSCQLDSTKYVAKRPGFKRMWINDDRGAVQQWLACGATPIVAKSPTGNIYKGLNDTNVNNYVKIHAGTNEAGKSYYAYLLEIPNHLYVELKIKPLREQQKKIMESLGIGDFDAGEVLGLDGALKNYVANNADGKAGYSEK